MQEQGFIIKHDIHVSNLKLMRIKRGMRQIDLSKASGVPVKCIGNYEQLKRNINHARVDIIYSLAAALECRIEDIMEDKKRLPG